MLEKLKQVFLDRIEIDAVKSEMTYRLKKDSKPITETVYMKRSKMPLIGDWARIYPPVNEDGSWNITNLIFGGKKNALRLIILGAIIAMALYGFYQVTSSCAYMAANPCEFCKNLVNIIP